MNAKLLAGLTLILAPAASIAFDFAALQSLIETRNPHSIEELLPALPASLRYRYALVFASRSLQDGSFEAPRAVLYGPDARFALTFNGASNQRGFNSLETMDFDPVSQQFQFREITFPATPSDSGKVGISEPNPSRCRRCHGSPAHPVWDTPPLWPGVYGERYGANLSAEEQSGIRRFLAQQKSDPRYRNLLGTSRFADPETFHPTARNRYSGTSAEPPNAELSAFLDQLVSRSIAAELSMTPGFAALQYLLLGVSDGRCGGLAAFYPAERWRTARRAFLSYREAIEKENARQQAADKLRVTPSNQKLGGFARDSATTLTSVRFVAESELNISTRGWTLAIEKSADDAASAKLALGSLRDSLLAKVVRNDAKVEELSEYATSSDGDRYCSYLQRQSRAMFSGQPSRVASAVGAADSPLGSPADEDRSLAGGLVPPRTLEICASCHRTNVAPNIPFDSAEELKELLLSRPSPHGYLIDEIRFRLSAQAGPTRMPLGVNLSDDQRAELENYFIQLAAQPRAPER